MSYRDLLVCIDASSMDSARVKLALNLAHAHRAYLTGVCVMPESQSIGARAPGFGSPETMSNLGIEGATPGGAVDEVFREAEAADIAEQWFKSELRLNGVEGEWHLLTAGETDALVELAKIADLTILGQTSREPDQTGSGRKTW